MDKFERFCYKHNHRGIANLMLFIAICNIFVYLVSELFEPNIRGWLVFSWGAVLSGQVWRLFTFVFIPLTTWGPIFLLITCYFYFWVGRALEQEWGKLKFNIFYLSGMIATMLFCMITGFPGTATYLNFSLFFAYATLFPERQILLFLIIPIKIKYMAFVMAGFFVLEILLGFGIFPYNLAPLVAIANYFLYFYKDFISFFKRTTANTKSRATYQSAVRQARKRPDFEGHVHKCAACGITDTVDPNMEFRYCSLCAHYECYCSQHIFTHEHTKP